MVSSRKQAYQFVKRQGQLPLFYGSCGPEVTHLWAFTGCRNSLTAGFQATASRPLHNLSQGHSKLLMACGITEQKWSSWGQMCPKPVFVPSPGRESPRFWLTLNPIFLQPLLPPGTAESLSGKASPCPGTGSTHTGSPGLWL